MVQSIVPLHTALVRHIENTGEGRANLENPAELKKK